MIFGAKSERRDLSEAISMELFILKECSISSPIPGIGGVE
jgi:hypothetical protein